VQVVEEVDTARVAHAHALLAGAQRDRLEDVALARSGLARDDDVLVALHEVEAREFEHERLVEVWLEVPLERFEGLALGEAARGDTAFDALLEFVCDLDAEEMLERRGWAKALTGDGGKAFVELAEGLRQAEELEMSAESREDVVVGGVWGLGICGSSGHGSFSSVQDRGAEVVGRRSYSVRSRGAVRA